MLSVKEAKRLCLEKYKELWGENWVTERYKSIADDWSSPLENVFYYGIDQDDRLAEPIKQTKQIKLLSGEETSPTHRTLFKVNLETETVEVLDHH